MKLLFLKKPGFIPGFFFFMACLALGVMVVKKNPTVNAYAQICYFVSEHIYLSHDEVKSWTRSCLQRAKLVKKETTVGTVIQDLNSQFSNLNTSHLSIYNAEESRKVWRGESKETGIESQFIDGELVIVRVHKDSPAEKAGLRMGDVIYRVNNELGDPSVVESSSGKYLIQRQKKITEYKIEAQEMFRDEVPELIPQSNQTVVFKVPSFRAEFFEKEKWRHQVAELKKYKKIIIDLRGNLGGNFVAGLRFLSPFMCSPQDIGYLWKPKSKLKKEMVLPDDLNDETQLEVLDQSFLVKLWTFEDYECLTATVAVLVDSGSASTAEMVAQALKDYIGAKIFGSASAGQLLVGVWYPVPELAEGVRISVPEAVYQTRRGHKIEGPGVQVDRVLYYHLNEMENGEDSWVKHAVQLF
jgi:carboxyl-terminal processing protease